MWRHTHEDKSLYSITYNNDDPMISPQAPSSPASASARGKTSLLHRERYEHCELYGGGDDDDNDEDHTSYVSFLFFSKQLFTSFQLAE